MNKLTGMLVYACIEQPVQCFEAKKGFEWKVSVVVDEDTADAFGEKFKKQSAKKIKRTDFKDQYAVEPPEGDSKNLFVITLKKPTKMRSRQTGEMIDVPPAYTPKVFLQTDEGRIDITTEKLVGNGSMGTVSFDEIEHPEFGISARLKNVLVTDLIEYVRRNQEAGAEFDAEAPAVDEFADKPVPAKKGSGKKTEADKAADSKGPF